MSRFHFYRKRRGKAVMKKLKKAEEEERQKPVINLNRIKKIKMARKIVKKIDG